MNFILIITLLFNGSLTGFFSISTKVKFFISSNYGSPWNPSRFPPTNSQDDRIIINFLRVFKLNPFKFLMKLFLSFFSFEGKTQLQQNK
jgi:hypothetical protein